MDDELKSKSTMVKPTPSQHPDIRMHLTLDDIAKLSYDPPWKFNPVPPPLVKGS